MLSLGFELKHLCNSNHMQQKLWEKNAVLQEQRTAVKAEVTIKIVYYLHICPMANTAPLNYEGFQGRDISLMDNRGARGKNSHPKY